MHRTLAILFISALTLGMLNLGFTEAAEAQSGSVQANTVWSGVYTETQAQKGQEVFQRLCSGCHGYELDGVNANPPLKGPKFLDNWREDQLESLFTKMRMTMPRRDPGVLSVAEYLEIEAYILQANGFPTGPNELTTGVLRGIQIQDKDGPKPLPNRAMIQVVGCMAPGEGDTWVLTKAPLPNRSRAIDTTTPEELKAAEAKPLGELTFRLENFENLGAVDHVKHQGHKMQAKGILMKQPSGDRISLFSLEMLSANCGN